MRNMVYDKKENAKKENYYQFGNLGVAKKKQLEPNFQYRWKHFEWKNGTLYSFFPKNKTNSSKCTLYCAKRGCEAKLKIDLALKKIILIGNHSDHEGINIEKLKWEYPELEKRDWKHLQYDCYHGKKILIWKF